MKSKKVAFLLSFFLGGLGVHRFYVGKIGTGILYLLTGGLCGIGVIVDFIMICVGEFKDKDGNKLTNDLTPAVIAIVASIFGLLFVIGFIGALTSSDADNNKVPDSGYESNYSDENYNTNYKDTSKEQIENKEQSEKQQNNQEEVKPEPVIEPTPVEPITYNTVSIRTMLDELENNALRAERTYQDMYVEITGYLASIDSDGGYFSVGVEADSWFFDSIDCDITDERQLEILIDKNEGDKLTVTGQITTVGEVIGYRIDVHSIK